MMQNGESAGRNATGSHNNNYHHNAIGHVPYAKNRPKVNQHHSMSNHRSSHTNSGFKSEEKERQKQEARAQREMTGRSAAPSPEQDKALFTVVPNTTGSDNDRVSKILGDYYLLTSCGNASNLIGIDEQPPTPAPDSSAHIHDPDNYNHPSVQHPSTSNKSSNYNSHRPHYSSLAQPINGPTRPKPTNHKSSSSFHHAKSIEESKRPHKSGPGPININDNINNRTAHNSERMSSTLSANRPASSSSHQKIRSSAHSRDLEIRQILNEVKNIKDPSSNLDYLTTPRPDHHQSSTFTFPPPVPPSIQPEFRVPMDPHVKGPLPMPGGRNLRSRGGWNGAGRGVHPPVAWLPPVARAQNWSIRSTEPKENAKTKLYDDKKKDRNANLKSTICQEALYLGRSSSSDRAKPNSKASVENIINNGCELGLSEDSEDEVSPSKHKPVAKCVQSKSKYSDASNSQKNFESAMRGNVDATSSMNSKFEAKNKLNGLVHPKNNLNSGPKNGFKYPTHIQNYPLNDESTLKSESYLGKPLESKAKLESTCSTEPKSAFSVFNLSDDLALSEDSELETSVNMNGRSSASNPNDTYVKPMTSSSYNEGPKAPMSPMTKSTDDSSNTDDSSDTESEESSSSDEEAKPPSPPQQDANPWNLYTIFNQNTNKTSESPKNLDGNQKNLSESLNGPPISPSHINEVAPPVVTKIPSMSKHRRPKVKPLPNLSSDDSSDEGEQVRRTPKPQKPVVGRPSNHSSYSKTIAKAKLHDPILSSDSEDDIPPPPMRKTSIPKSSRLNPSRSISKSPRGGVAASSKYKKKPEVKKKESDRIKSKAQVPSDLDSDSDKSMSSSSKLKMRPSSAASDHSSKNSLMSPKLSSPANISKESYEKSVRSRVTSELKSDMRLKMSVPVSKSDIENLKLPKSAKPDKKKRKSHSERESKSVSVPERVVEAVSSRLELPPAVSLHNSPHQKYNLAGQVQYDKGIAKLVCSIPYTLIDKLPGIKSEDKVNKEVLEMRTSGVGAKKKNNKSPPNEDNTKLRAICSIYKKRPSSLEPDRIKRDIKSEDTFKVKSEDNQTIKNKAKLEINSELKTKVEVPLKIESKLKRQGSNSSLSSTNTQESSSNHKSTRHKKDKRKERSSSSKDRAMEESNMEIDKSAANRKKRQSSLEVEPPLSKKRTRENRHESSRGREVTSSHRSKIAKISSDDVCSPSRRTSEERPLSSMSGGHYSRRSKKSSQQTAPKTFDSEEEIPVDETSLFRNKQSLGEEGIAGTSGDTSEYHSLPSSEHESRNGAGSNYRTGPSPIPTEVSDMYPPNTSQTDLTYGSQHYEPLGSRQLALRNYHYSDRKSVDIRKDHTTYLNRAKELKHKADRESQNRTMQTALYLEAVLYFILTGESMESDSYDSAYKMFNDTLVLIRFVHRKFVYGEYSPFRHVSSIFCREILAGKNKVNIILVVLSMRCQSLLALKLFLMKSHEMKEPHKYLAEYAKSYNKAAHQGHAGSTPSTGGAAVATLASGGGTPGLPNGWSQRSGGVNNSPSSLSPTPSPAGSVGSEGSQSSSGYSTEGTRQQRGSQAGPSNLGLTTPPHLTVCITAEIHAAFLKYHNLSYPLYQATEMWSEANDYNRHEDIKDFFFNIDQQMGPLTFNCSLRELVPYVQEALNRLKMMTALQQTDVSPCSSKMK